MHAMTTISWVYLINPEPQCKGSCWLRILSMIEKTDEKCHRSDWRIYRNMSVLRLKTMPLGVSPLCTQLYSSLMGWVYYISLPLSLKPQLYFRGTCNLVNAMVGLLTCVVPNLILFSCYSFTLGHYFRVSSPSGFLVNLLFLRLGGAWQTLGERGLKPLETLMLTWP